ncbi:MAG: hypothetical protein LBP59_18960 [Planctomycetaceae bacterium]|nr:hypothetical protein [Planctomycetaceae bacterium]
MRLYSTADERGYILNSLFVCLSANCRRDARDPLVLPVFQDCGCSVCVLSHYLFVLKNSVSIVPHCSANMPATTLQR